MIFSYITFKKQNLTTHIMVMVIMMSPNFRSPELISD